MEEQFNNDHDILITLVAEVRQARADIKELKDGYGDKISDHEKRIEFLERGKDKNFTYIKLGYGVGIFAILVMLGLLIYHITGYHI